MMEGAGEAESTVAMHVIAVDAEICRGCDMCTLACSLHHTGQCRPSLARLRVSRDIERYRFTISICRQCDDPACLDACPVEGAMAWDGEASSRLSRRRALGVGAARLPAPTVASTIMMGWASI